MTDLDKIKLCAEAMSLRVIVDRDEIRLEGWLGGDFEPTYDPLHDDAQCMALVKKFHLQLHFINPVRGWFVGPPGLDMPLGTSASDLNRAIVECVAKMRAAK